MSLSIYVHIPYCIQRCRYCDFTTFEQNSIMPPEQYLDLILAEIRNRHNGVKKQHLRSVYFGGGTPSLVPPNHIVSILSELSNVGFILDQSTEVTLEINPATLNQEKLDIYFNNGVNRFSVGAQTFNDSLLELCGREHSADDTRKTLRLLESNKSDYSFDILFALPRQSLEELREDLKELQDFRPVHVSAYCLTVPSGHPMSRGRPPEEEQIEMFQLIETELAKYGIDKYEISNFAQPGKESQHNLSYWTNLSFWGLGLSAHSYFLDGDHGTRFWNPKSFPDYIRQLDLSVPSRPWEALDPAQVEALTFFESLTDICHMFLRLKSGIPEAPLHKWFSSQELCPLWPRLDKLCSQGLLNKTHSGWALSSRGEVLSNQVFQELTFLVDDWD